MSSGFFRPAGRRTVTETSIRLACGWSRLRDLVEKVILNLPARPAPEPSAGKGAEVGKFARDERLLDIADWLIEDRNSLKTVRTK